MSNYVYDLSFPHKVSKVVHDLGIDNVLSLIDSPKTYSIATDLMNIPVLRVYKNAQGRIICDQLTKTSQTTAYNPSLFDDQLESLLSTLISKFSINTTTLDTYSGDSFNAVADFGLFILRRVWETDTRLDEWVGLTSLGMPIYVRIDHFINLLAQLIGSNVYAASTTEVLKTVEIDLSSISTSTFAYNPTYKTRTVSSAIPYPTVINDGQIKRNWTNGLQPGIAGIRLESDKVSFVDMSVTNVTDQRLKVNGIPRNKIKKFTINREGANPITVRSTNLHKLAFPADRSYLNGTDVVLASSPGQTYLDLKLENSYVLSAARIKVEAWMPENYSKVDNTQTLLVSLLTNTLPSNYMIRKGDIDSLTPFSLTVHNVRFAFDRPTFLDDSSVMSITRVMSTPIQNDPSRYTYMKNYIIDVSHPVIEPYFTEAEISIQPLAYDLPANHSHFMATISSLAVSSFSSYEFPEVLVIDDNQIKRVNRLTDYIMSNISEDEVFVSATRKFDRSIQSNVALINLLISDGLDNEIMDDGRPASMFMDDVFPITGVPEKFLIAGFTLDEYNNFKTIMTELNITTWDQYFFYMQKLNNSDSYIDETGELILSEDLLNDGFNYRALDDVSDLLDLKIIPDLTGYINENIVPYATLMTLQSGVLNGIAADQLAEALNENVQSLMQQFMSESIQFPGQDMIFDKFDKIKSSNYINFLNFARQADVGVDLITASVGGAILERATKSINNNKLIKDFVNFDINNLINIRNYKESRSLFKTANSVASLVANEEVILATTGYSSLYPKSSGFSLLVDQSVDAMIAAGSSAFEWLRDDSMKAIIGGFNVVGNILSLAAKKLYNFVDWATSIHLDGLSFKEYPDYNLDTIDIPIYSGSVLTPTALWKERGLQSSLNYLSLPVNSTGRIILIPDLNNGKKVHYQIFAGIHKAKVPNRILDISLDGASMNDYKIGDAKCDIIVNREYVTNNNRIIPLRISVPIASNLSGLPPSNKSRRIMKVKLLFTSGEVIDGQISVNGLVKGTSTDSQSGLVFDIAGLDLKLNDTLSFNINLKVDHIYPLEEDFSISVNNIELFDEFGDYSYINDDMSFVEQIVSSTNSTLSVLNEIAALSVGSGNVQYLLNVDFNAKSSLQNLFNSLRNNEDFIASVAARRFGNDAAVLGGSTAAGAAIGTVVPVIGTGIGAMIGYTIGTALIVINELKKDEDGSYKSMIERQINASFSSADAYNLLSLIMDDDNLESIMINKSGSVAEAWTGSIASFLDLALTSFINIGALRQLSAQLSFDDINPGLNRIDLPAFQSLPKARYGIKTSEDIKAEASGDLSKLSLIILTIVVAAVAVKFRGNIGSIAKNLIVKKYKKYKTKKMINSVVASNLVDVADKADIGELLDNKQFNINLLHLAESLALIRGISIEDATKSLLDTLLGHTKDPSSFSF